MNGVSKEGGIWRQISTQGEWYMKMKAEIGLILLTSQRRSKIASKLPETR